MYVFSASLHLPIPIISFVEKEEKGQGEAGRQASYLSSLLCALFHLYLRKEEELWEAGERGKEKEFGREKGKLGEWVWDRFWVSFISRHALPALENRQPGAAGLILYTHTPSLMHYSILKTYL